jgi:uncharacterized membrane protein
MIHINTISFIKQRITRYDIGLLVAMAIYAVLMSILCLYRYTTFFADIDLAIFNQSLWTTIHNGGILQNTFEFKELSHLGVHFSPILLTLLPVYLFFPGCETLIVSQTILLCLGVIPIYLVARERLGVPAACGIGILYLMYPPLHGVNLYDYHEVAFLPFLLGMGIWGYISDRKNICFIFCLLCLLVKEDMFPVIFMIGLSGLIWSRSKPVQEKWQYIILLVLPIVMLVLYIFVMKSAIYGEGITDGSHALSQYADLATNLVSNNDARIFYLIMIFLPLVFLPLLSPEILIIALPVFGETLLAPDSFYYNISGHHSAPLIPILFIAFILSLEKIQKIEIPRLKFTGVHFIGLSIIISLILCVSYSPAVKEFSFMTADHPDLEEHVFQLTKIIEAVPSDASVATQDNLVPQLSGRTNIWHTYTNRADIILYDTAYPQSSEFTEKRKEIESEYSRIPAENHIFVYIKKKKQ